MNRFVTRAPEIVFKWQDTQTEAVGWLVINSLRGGAAGGGTRMRMGLTEKEVITLAKTMEIKFTVCGPPIGGAKAGLNFDPQDPRKGEVLERWFQAVAPLLKRYYGTSGDLNVNEWTDIVPFLRKEGIAHPQAGIVRGHFGTEGSGAKKIESLQSGLKTTIRNERYAPSSRCDVSRMITGYGVSEAVRLFYELWGGAVRDKRVIVQGWGNVGAAAGWYLSRLGAKIVGITDAEGFLACPAGLEKDAIDALFTHKKEGFARSPHRVEHASEVWEMEAEVFIPAAASALLEREQLTLMNSRGLQLIVSGANAPFREEGLLYGKTTQYADATFSLIPDFIANCGMARTFAYLMEHEAERHVAERIFEDVSTTIKASLQRVRAENSGHTGLSAKAYETALKHLESNA